MHLTCSDGARTLSYTPACVDGAFSQPITTDRGHTTACTAACVDGARRSPDSNPVQVTAVEVWDTWETEGSYGDGPDDPIVPTNPLGDGADLVITGNILDEWGDRADWIRVDTTDNPVADAIAGRNAWRFDVALEEGDATYDLWVWRHAPTRLPEHHASGPYDATSFDLVDRGDAPNHPAAAVPDACAARAGPRWTQYNECVDQTSTWWIQVLREGPEDGLPWRLRVRTGDP